MIFVHSKGMIVDVEDVIIGSANVNQRSMEGSGDTEIAMGAYQPHHTWARKLSNPQRQVFSKITVSYFINCDYYGKMRMMEVELKNMKSREKVFRCHVCALHDHPNNWNSYWLDSAADDDQKLFNGAGAAHTVEPIDQIGF